MEKLTAEKVLRALETGRFYDFYENAFYHYVNDNKEDPRLPTKEQILEKIKILFDV